MVYRDDTRARPGLSCAARPGRNSQPSYVLYHPEGSHRAPTFPPDRQSRGCQPRDATGARHASVSERNDLDAFMSRVLARRDENWKKLQQYVLEERETFQHRRARGTPLFGFRRE